jgi:hypothetical protein
MSDMSAKSIIGNNAAAGNPAAEPRGKSDAAILAKYRHTEFYRPAVVDGYIAAVDKRMETNSVTVIRPNVNGFEVRAIRDVLRNHGFVVDAPERGFYHAIDQLTVTRA